MTPTTAPTPSPTPAPTASPTSNASSTSAQGSTCFGADCPTPAPTATQENIYDKMFSHGVVATLALVAPLVVLLLVERFDIEPYSDFSSK